MNTTKDLIMRPIRDEDIEDIVNISKVSFGHPKIGFKRKQFESQIRIFPEGQFCIEYEGKIVGSCSSMIVNFDEFGENHSFSEISDNGYIRNHNPNGKNLYGTEVVVDPNYRGMRIGRRLYEGRRELCKKYDLESIIFGGRIPNFHKYADELSVEDYVEKVKSGELYDPVLTFQLRNGFEVIGIMADYLMLDAESLRYATLMEWKNPDYSGHK